MGRRISKEFLHPSILEGVNDKIGNLDSLETDAKGNMVQAINELVEKLDNSAEIENGKELIANAVGEPLTVEESFDEMSNDINGLLSTFKTNMMNNGVSVESGDRFKALIDKIATLADNEGKGIQFAEGECAFTTQFADSSMSVDNLNLSFDPTILFVYGYMPVHDGNTYVQSIGGFASNIAGMESTDSGDSLTITNVSRNGFTMTTKKNVLGYWTPQKYVAIGVGEEDTTLRDSLASILQEEGVSVTEEDDMASLISKVDEEFDRQVVPAGDAVAEDVIAGKTFMNSTGQLVTGTGNKGYNIIAGADITFYNVEINNAEDMIESQSYAENWNWQTFTKSTYQYKVVYDGVYTVAYYITLNSARKTVAKVAVYNGSSIRYESSTIEPTVSSARWYTFNIEAKSGDVIKLMGKFANYGSLEVSGITVTATLN